MQEELLELVENTSHKDSFQVIVSDDTTRFTKRFNPIQLKKNRPYEIALVNLEIYYSIPNINNKNNPFRYSAINGGADWHTVDIPTGSYDIEDINDVIQEE